MYLAFGGIINNIPKKYACVDIGLLTAVGESIYFHLRRRYRVTD